MSPILKVVPTTANYEMNVSLLDSTIIEVREAMFSMALDKSIGPNGISAMFYQHYLDIISNTTSNLVLGFLNNKRDLFHINNTLIAHILKIKTPKHVVIDFRPIIVSTMFSIKLSPRHLPFV